MQVSALQTLMLSWLDDPNAGYFDSNTTFTWLNLAQRQVQQELLLAGENWYQIPVETLTVVNQADYLLPSDFMTLHRLEIILSGTVGSPQENRQPLTHITTNQQDLLTVVSDVPTNFVLKKDRFTLYPTPSQVWTMRLYYSYRVADLITTSDVPDIPEQFMEYMALLACYDGFIKDDRAAEVLQAKKMKYENMLTKMKTARAQDVARQVVQTITWDGGAWF